jgi:hypothetical protein
MLVGWLDAIVCCAENFEIFCSVKNALIILQEISNDLTEGTKIDLVCYFHAYLCCLSQSITELAKTTNLILETEKCVRSSQYELKRAIAWKLIQ